MSDTVKTLMKPMQITRLMFIKIVIMSAAIGAGMAVISTVIGVITVIAGGLMMFQYVYAAVIGVKEKVVG